jgi:DNA-binding PucR family transcriptional regulator
VTSGAPVAVFDDLGVLRFLLAPGDREELTGFARHVLGAVVDYDLEHSAGLIETVEAYLAEDCSLQRTAERLRIHRKTVRYRLDRVEKLTQRNLSSQQDRFEAQLAVTIIRALSLRGRAKPDVR